ncbi:porin family protein [Aliidiomarina halalkaliphila]|uniref:Porin family protein n=1 Tax=Aliidiomarina halalkaliphila TaxID=2593535 RepID=A0A552X5C0_9GAMM|nr:outer membrane beta-barrel protein [Aliidiomarina halalkaliphila]TRW50166.1 porin family protein [Aliidiomarina halalkaliphila]
MKTRVKHWLQATGVAAFILTSAAFVAPGNAHAQAFERDWKVSVHTGRASLDRFTTGSGTWDSITDDSGTIYGGSLSYFLHPNLSVRGTYERGSDFRTINSCPDNGTCPAIAITERGDVQHFAAALVPEVSLTEKVDLFGSIGLGTTRKSAGPTLDNYSDNGLVYGAGIGYRLDRRFYVSGEYQRSSSDYDVFRVAFSIRF